MTEIGPADRYVDPQGNVHPDVLMKPYVYSPIGPGNIRLFQIVSHTEELRCMMQYFKLEECPPYHAVSYAWGSGRPSHRLVFEEDRSHLVTEHLHQGLTSSLSILSPRWFWIDQICINQNDNEEKSAQVRLMGDIYANAVQTIVWLGADYQKSDLAMSHVEGIAELIRAYDFDSELAQQSPHELGFPHEDDQVWPALQCLFGRLWWKRLWIVQEAIKAKDIVFIVGSRAAPYDDFRTLSTAHERLLGVLPGSTHHLGIFKGFSKAFYCLRNDMLRSIDEFRSGKTKIIDGEPNPDNFAEFASNMLVVQEFSIGQSCGEPVDRVYAILGLVGSFVKSKITIEYSSEGKRDYWRVFVQFYRCLISMFIDRGYLLTTLCFGQHTANTPESLPSWCPDLTNPVRRSRPCLTPSGASRVPFDAAWKPDCRMIEPCNSNPRILHVMGACIDTIKIIIPLWSAPQPLIFDKFTCGNATEVKKSMNACFKLTESIRKSSEDFSWIDALFRTWVMNTRQSSNDAYPAETIITDCLAFINRLTAIIDHSHSGADLDATEVSAEASRYASSYFAYTRNRALFIAHGDKLGLCDAAAEVGDEVAFWFNCAYPVIQRVIQGTGGCDDTESTDTTISQKHTLLAATTDSFITSRPGKRHGEIRERQHRKLISHCYIDGFMNGEIFDEKDFEKEGYSNFLIV